MAALCSLLLAWAGPAAAGDDEAAQRAKMVRRQLARRDITAPSVLDAMGKVPRHRFVPEALRSEAYDDHPLPIGHDQTISQPYIVALMTQLADLSPGERVLEIGTGSGYQAAVLAALGVTVYSIEIVEPLGQRAAQTLAELGLTDIQLRIGDGYQGWPEAAPFDAIVVTAAPPAIPEPLRKQLAIGGRLVAPVGDLEQHLVVVTRTKTGFKESRIAPVRFVPMTGEARNAP